MPAPTRRSPSRKQWNTSALETDTWLGSATIQDGNYNLALAAVPSGQDTILLAGANDLVEVQPGDGLRVAQHHQRHDLHERAGSGIPARPGVECQPIRWNCLWATTAGCGVRPTASRESGPVCSSSDASHFQNLNGGLGSLAEVESMSAVGASPYTMMLGLGANGTAGVKSTTGPTADWPQILTGEGGPVAIDPTNPANWYVNNGAGVSIHLCSQSRRLHPDGLWLNARWSPTPM